jgi:hypothetical protein
MPIGRPLDLTANVATKNITATATDSQTQFTVNGGYRVNELGVYRNGVRLVDGTDFTATDGSTVTLLTPAVTGDVVSFAIFDSFNIADAIQGNASDQTINGNLTITGDLVGVSTRFTGAIGIESGGTAIGQGVTTLNFVGSGNTFAYDASTNTVDISISGSGGGGGLGTAINYADGETATPFSYIGNSVKVTENLAINTSNAGGNTSYVVTVIPNVEISSGVAVTVGTGKTMIIDVLKIGDL